jgi:hypothetical protein
LDGWLIEKKKKTYVVDHSRIAWYFGRDGIFGTGAQFVAWKNEETEAR